MAGPAGPRITLKIVGQGGIVLQMRLKASTKMKKMKRLYMQQMGEAGQTFKFLHMGSWIGDLDTAETLKLSEEDTVLAARESLHCPFVSCVLRPLCLEELSYHLVNSHGEDRLLDQGMELAEEDYRVFGLMYSLVQASLELSWAERKGSLPDFTTSMEKFHGVKDQLVRAFYGAVELEKFRNLLKKEFVNILKDLTLILAEFCRPQTLLSLCLEKVAETGRTFPEHVDLPYVPPTTISFLPSRQPLLSVLPDLPFADLTDLPYPDQFDHPFPSLPLSLQLQLRTWSSTKKTLLREKGQAMAAIVIRIKMLTVRIGQLT